MRKKDKYPEFAGLIKGSSPKQLFDFFYFAYICRYTTKDHLNAFNNKLGTPKKLKWLTDNGYINFTEAFFTTKKTCNILKEQSYPTLVKIMDGNLTSHHLLLSDFLQKEFKREDFFTAFYPHFGEFIPDACLIYKKENAYKIVFLEVEEEKPNWSAYLNEKREKYNALAKDKDIYLKWWRTYSELLGLPYCTMEQFCFSVLCTSKITFNWEGWEWHTQSIF